MFFPAYSLSYTTCLSFIRHPVSRSLQRKSNRINSLFILFVFSRLYLRSTQRTHFLYHLLFLALATFQCSACVLFFTTLFLSFLTFLRSVLYTLHTVSSLINSLLSSLAVTQSLEDRVTRMTTSIILHSITRLAALLPMVQGSQESCIRPWLDSFH